MTGKNISITAILGILIALQALGYGLVTESSLKPMRCQMAHNLEGNSRSSLARIAKEVDGEPSTIEREQTEKSEHNLEWALEQQKAYCQ